MSVIESDRLPPVRKNAPAGSNGYVHQKLTPHRVVLILKCIYTLTKEYRWWLLAGIMLSSVYAFVGAWFDWPLKYIIDNTTNTDPHTMHEPYGVYMPQAVKLFLLIYGLHNIILPFLQNAVKAYLQAHVRKTLSLRAAEDLHLSNSVDENMQPWIQTSREQILNVLLSVVFEAPLYIRGLCILAYFLYIAWTAPYFGIVAIGGIGLYGSVTYLIGILIGNLFHDKQVALMEVQKMEVQTCDELLKSKADRPATIIAFPRLRVVSSAKVSFGQLPGVWNTYVGTYITSEIRLLACNIFIRDLVLEVTRIVALAIALWYGSEGIITYGTAFFLFGLIGKAAEPFSLFGPLQKQLLDAQLFVDWYMGNSNMQDPKPRQPQ